MVKEIWGLRGLAPSELLEVAPWILDKCRVKS